MLKIYNSLSRKVEQFKPLVAKKVGIYVCGPTVYGPTHLGHARTWIFFDWLRRYFLHQGYEVKFVQNITDVGHLVDDVEAGEDKIEKKAKAEGKTPEEIARFYEKAYFDDLKSLNILKPDFSPRASEHIQDMIKFIEVLLKKSNAYEAQGNVYFDVGSFASYGKLSGRSIEEGLTDTRVKKDSLKKNQADFALWLKADPSHIQKWDSPWGLSRAGSRGEGYPGWHIECSVMAEKILGQPFDIHGSASEHIFPHHENEIAQSESYAGKPLANYFLHSGMLKINGQKMSKSSGNYLTVEDVLKKNDADTVKLAFMGTFWRKPYDWFESAIFEARKTVEKLLRAKMIAREGKSVIRDKVLQALEDDFNLPKVLTVVLDNLGSLNKGDFEFLEKIFGLDLVAVKLTNEQNDLVQKREDARKQGDFKEADRLREVLEEQGIIVEDTQDGSRILKT